jgi:HK97 family phage portal protein
MVTNISAIANIINAIKEMAKGGSTKNRLMYLSDWYYNKELANPENYTSLLNAYKSWVYVCASKNAISFASFPLRLYVAKPSKSKMLVQTRTISKETKKFLFSSEMGHLDKYLRKAVEVEEVLEHPFLELMKNVNPFLNEFELKEMTCLNQELTGNNYWYLLNNNMGLPTQVWLVPPDKMKIIPSKEKFISGYLYRNGLDEVIFDNLEIIHYKYPSPTSTYYGMSPLSAVASAYNINENMNKFENSLFSNMARPDGILTTDLSINADEHKRMGTEWNQRYGGVNKVGKTAILTNGLKYQPITFTPRELNFLSGRRITKEEICNAYGQSIALYDKDANRANSDNATYMFMKDTISPRHRRYEQKINEQILPRYDDKLFCAIDNCVPEDKVFEQLARMENVNAGILSRSEVRAELGIIERPECDGILVPNNLVPIEDLPITQNIQQYSLEIAKRVREKLIEKV